MTSCWFINRRGVFDWNPCYNVLLKCLRSNTCIVTKSTINLICAFVISAMLYRQIHQWGRECVLHTRMQGKASKSVDISSLGTCLFCWGLLIDDFTWIMLLTDLWYTSVVWETWGRGGHDGPREEKHNPPVYSVLRLWLL